MEESTTNVVGEIEKRLSGTGGEKAEEGIMVSETPLPFDIGLLNKEQLQLLKSMLAATPETIQRKKENPRVFMRVIDGKIVVDFGRAFQGLIRDENNKEVERPLIKILLRGETGWKTIPFKEFINSERVSCEVLETKYNTTEVIEGETISRETGRKVEIIRKDVHYSFTIKLPNDEKMEIESTKIGN